MPSSTQEPVAIDCFASDETKTVKLPPTRYWVEIKRHLDAGEQADIDEALFDSVSMEDREAAAATGRKLYLSLAKQRFLKLAVFVVDWNLCDEKGVTVRLPSALQDRVVVMRKLSRKMAELITTAVDEVAAEELKSLEADAEDDSGNPTPAGNGTG